MSILYTKITSYSRFIKLEHTVFALPFGLSAYLLILDKIGFKILDLIVLIIAISAIRTYGMAINRIIDRRIDAKNPRTKNRELVTGDVRLRGAIIFSILSLVIFYSSLLRFNPITFPLSPLVVVLFTFYPLTKRFTYLSHFVLGLVYFILPPAVEIAFTGTFSITTLMLGISGFFWVSGFDVIYAVLDIKFDQSEDLKSIPATFGIKTSVWITHVCHIITLITIIYIGFIETSHYIYWIGCTIIVGLFFREHILMRTLRQQNIQKAFFDMNAIISFAFLTTVLLSKLLGE